MSYVAESIHNMTKEDQRAWALMQTGPGFMVDRIAEAEELLNWLLSAPASSKDGESVGEVTTPSRTETVAPDTQPVMQPCTHTRTDGEGV